MNPLLIQGGVARAAAGADRFGPGRALDARTKAYLEGYFGRDLGFVRVHTGRAAGLATRLVGARAFASGRHLVFGAGEYQPGTPEGMRLLVHEAAHAVQQARGRGPDVSALGVGDAADPIEREAEEAAERAMAGRNCPRLSADRAGLIRRAVRVDPKSVTFDVVARPGVLKPVIPHPDDDDFAFFDSERIKIEARLTLVGDPGESPVGWSVGFIQLQFIETTWVHYRGQKSGHGSLFLQRGRAPARPVQACVDTQKAGGFFAKPAEVQTPRTTALPQTFEFLVAKKTHFTDKPSDACRLKEANSKTKQVNFLREVQLESHFLTILTAREPSGRMHHLKSVLWNLRSQARFLPGNFADLKAPWQITVVPGGTGANASKVMDGIPNDRRFNSLLSKPPTTTCNTLSVDAFNAVEDPKSPNRREHADWSDFIVTR